MAEGREEVPELAEGSGSKLIEFLGVCEGGHKKISKLAGDHLFKLIEFT